MSYKDHEVRPLSTATFVLKSLFLVIQVHLRVSIRI